jgi:hypothetical protein
MDANDASLAGVPDAWVRRAETTGITRAEPRRVRGRAARARARRVTGRPASDPARRVERRRSMRRDAFDTSSGRKTGAVAVSPRIEPPVQYAAAVRCTIRRDALRYL